MNNKFQDEKMTTNSKEKKVNLLFSYKDKLIPKYKILPNLKSQIEKKSFSKFFDEESSINPFNSLNISTLLFNSGLDAVSS